MSVSDSGQRSTPDRSHTPPPQQHLADALAAFTRSSGATSRIPTAYITALRTSAPGEHHNITVNGHAVTLTIAQSSGPYNPQREAESWDELRRAVSTTTRSGACALPREIAAASWTRNGRTIRARRHRTSRRRRRRLAALPTPLLSHMLATPAASSGAALSIALTPLAPIPQERPIPQPPANTLPADLFDRSAPSQVPDYTTRMPWPAPQPPPMRRTRPADPDAASDTTPPPARRTPPTTRNVPPPRTHRPAPTTAPAPRPAPTTSPTPTRRPGLPDLVDRLIPDPPPARTDRPRPIRSLLDELTKQ